MYVMVLHEIANPEMFWKKAVDLLGELPPDVVLHHSFSSPEGTRAVCIWEAETIDKVKNLLAPRFSGTSLDTYMPTHNKEGVVGPPKFVEQPAAV